MAKGAPCADTQVKNQRGSAVGMVGTNIGAGEKSEWVRAHQALSRLARERAAADAEERRRNRVSPRYRPRFSPLSAASAFEKARSVERWQNRATAVIETPASNAACETHWPS